MLQGLARHDRPRAHLRHHAARWRTIAGLLDDRSAEARARAQPLRTWSRRDRGRLPGGESRRFRIGGSHCPRSAWCRRGGTRSLPGQRYRARGRRAGGCRSAAHPRLHRHQRHPHAAQAAHESRASPRRHRRGRGAGAFALRRRRILCRGRQSLRSRLPLRGVQRRHRGRRQHPQRPRHGGLRGTRGVRSPVRVPARARARRRARGAFQPLP